MNETRGLWRGKRKETGEWAYGCLVRSSLRATIFVLDENTNRMSGTEVDPSTLGECTGLRDKNGKLIFEGDIVEAVGINEKQIAPIAFRKGFFIVDGKYGIFRIGVGTYKRQQLKIIGNIHDNPELLKQEERDGNNP